MIAWARTHRSLVITAVGLAIAAVVFVVVWFQPQKLFIETEVNEAAPMVSDEPAATPALSADFIAIGHEAAGRALVTGSEDSRFVRFEDFRVENGPDLVVYLSKAPADVPEDDEFARDFVDLGQLKANSGNQNYKIPAGTDLDEYRTVVIWCRRFTVAFAAAELA